VLTLYVIPAIYSYFSKETKRKHWPRTYEAVRRETFEEVEA
jgi:hypothetical protein